MSMYTSVNGVGGAAMIADFEMIGSNENEESLDVVAGPTHVKLLLVDDHQLFREGLRRILEMEKDFEILGECGDGKAALELSESLKPDVVLMDINMPIENGVLATARLRESSPHIKVIMLSIHDDESYVFESLRIGASGYLLKDMEAESLVKAVRAVASGQGYIHPKVTGKLIDQLRRMTYLNTDGVIRELKSIGATGVKYYRTPDNPLTKREGEVLRMMAEGKSNRDIGEDLFISEKTVKNHVSSILQKLEVDDRTQAVIRSIKTGWITL